MATTSTTLKSAGPLPGSRTFLSRLTDGDEIARLTTMVFAATVVLLTTALVWELWVNSALPRHKFGFHFLFTQTWDPIMDDFGALPFIYGTVVTSAVSLFIAIPLGIGAAIFLAELAPARVVRHAAILHRSAGRGAQRDLWVAGNISLWCPWCGM